MTCAIIDDEPLAVKLLESYVEKTPELTLCGSYSSAVKAIGGLAQQPVDILFLDINMPDVDGISFARMIQNGNMQIVFTTAFSEYAVESYKVSAADYLLKPIVYEDFLASISKATKIIETRKVAAANNADNAPAAHNDCIYVRSDYKLMRLATDDINYIEGLKDYVKIHFVDDRPPVLTLASILAVEASLPKNFMRVHRSYIVNLDKITIIERGSIIFGEEALPISDSYKEKLQAYIQERTFNAR